MAINDIIMAAAGVSSAPAKRPEVVFHLTGEDKADYSLSALPLLAERGSGSVTNNTSVKKFRSASLQFGTGKVLEFQHTSSTLFWQGDYTVQMWLYMNSQSSMGRAQYHEGDWFNVDFYRTGGTAPFNQLWYYEGNSWSGGGTIPLQQWSHIALSHSSGVLRYYIDGAQVYSKSSGNQSETQLKKFWIGGGYNGSTVFDNLNGYIEDFVIAKQAYYTGSSYTLPTAIFT